MSTTSAAQRDVRDSSAGTPPSVARPFLPDPGVPSTFVPKTPQSLSPFFRLAAACPPLAHGLRPVGCLVVTLVAPRVCRAIRQNSLRILGRELPPIEQRRFARRVIGSFYDFIVDVGRVSRMSAQQLGGLVEDVEGLEAYRAVRATKRGAILVTAHLGTFEAGLAALVREEPRVHVVFKRDSVPAFELMREKLHKEIGIIETPIDDGVGSWLTLREALRNDGVIVMQGDRAVPGQKSEVVPFLHGHLRVPTGSVRLAQLTGSPIIPVFALRAPSGGYRVLLKTAIEPDGGCDTPLDRNLGPSPALRALADAMAAVVAAHPHEWLALEPVFHEDSADASR